MPTRREVLSRAAEDCMKELYRNVQPKVEWDDFIEQNKEYSKKYKEWENTHIKGEDGKIHHPNINEFCGPRPYEMYYLPREVMKDICDSYVNAYRMDIHKEFEDNIDILKNYCMEPTVDKYIDDYTDEYGNHHPGYRGYGHPENVISAMTKELGSEEKAKKAWEIVCKYFDMAQNFFCWNSDLNAFNTTVYLGCSPNSNKEAVIDNWKKYKGIDISINDDIYKDDYEDEDYNDEEEN